LEKLGDLKAAKKDYREGAKKGSEYAAEALNDLLRREKENKRK
jgi:TPR repeat protein